MMFSFLDGTWKDWSCHSPPNRQGRISMKLLLGRMKLWLIRPAPCMPTCSKDEDSAMQHRRRRCRLCSKEKKKMKIQLCSKDCTDAKRINCAGTERQEEVSCAIVYVKNVAGYKN